MILKGKIVTLRTLEFEDIELLRQIVNDPWMEEHIIGWSFPISKKDQENWFKSFSNSDKIVRYVIETENDGIVGFTGLRNIDWKNGSVETAGIRIIQKENMSHGIATDSYMTLLKYVFYELRLNRISDSTFYHNEAMKRVFKKTGFKLEGIERESQYKNGQFYDKCLYGSLKKDYDAIEIKYK